MSDQVDSAPPARLEHMVRHQVSGRVSTEFVMEMDGALQRIPATVMNRIVEGGNTLAFVETVFEARPDLRGKKPVNVLPGTTFENVRGFFDAETKTLYVPEYYRPRHQLARGLVKNVMAAAVLRHELGHALDRTLGLASATAEFQEAYVVDFTNISNYIIDYYSYFWRADEDRNRREVFAELFATYYGGGPHDRSKQIRAVFGRCDEILQKWLREIIP